MEQWWLHHKNALSAVKNWEPIETNEAHDIDDSPNRETSCVAHGVDNKEKEVGEEITPSSGLVLDTNELEKEKKDLLEDFTGRVPLLLDIVFRGGKVDVESQELKKFGEQTYLFAVDKQNTLRNNPELLRQ